MSWSHNNEVRPFFLFQYIEQQCPICGIYQNSLWEYAGKYFQRFFFNGYFYSPTSNVHSFNIISGSSDPWIIPTKDQIDSFGDVMPLSPLEINYQEIVLALMAASKSHAFFNMNLDTYVPSPWLGS